MIDKRKIQKKLKQLLKHAGLRPSPPGRLPCLFHTRAFQNSNVSGHARTAVFDSRRASNTAAAPLTPDQVSVIHNRDVAVGSENERKY